MTVRKIRVSELSECGVGAGVVLDVRSRAEFAEGHVPGAVNVPLDELDAAAGQYTGQMVVTVCRSGVRSATAAQVLTAAGAQAWSLAGGTQAWLEAGNKVERGADRR